MNYIKQSQHDYLIWSNGFIPFFVRRLMEKAMLPLMLRFVEFKWNDEKRLMVQRNVPNLYVTNICWVSNSKYRRVVFELDALYGKVYSKKLNVRNYTMVYHSLHKNMKRKILYYYCSFFWILFLSLICHT